MRLFIIISIKVLPDWIRQGKKNKIDPILNKIEKLKQTKLSEKNNFILSYLWKLLKNKSDSLSPVKETLKSDIQTPKVNTSCSDYTTYSIFKIRNDNWVCKFQDWKNYVSFWDKNFWPYDDLDTPFAYSSWSSFWFSYTIWEKLYYNINWKVFWPYNWGFLDLRNYFRMDWDNYTFAYQQNKDYSNPIYYVNANWKEFWPFDYLWGRTLLVWDKYIFSYWMFKWEYTKIWVKMFSDYINLNWKEYTNFWNSHINDIYFDGINSLFVYWKNSDYYVNFNLTETYWPYSDSNPFPYNPVVWMVLKWDNFWFYHIDNKGKNYNLIINWKEKWVFKYKDPIDLDKYTK